MPHHKIYENKMMSKDQKYNTNISVPETMLALIASGKGFDNLDVAEVPVPQVGSDQLLARVDAAGIPALTRF